MARYRSAVFTLDLVRLIHEVPEILRDLSWNTRLALFATNRELHTQIRESIKLLVINPGSSLLLNAAHFPALKALSCHHTIAPIELRLSGTWQNLDTVDFSGVRLDYTCLLLMIRGDWPLLDDLRLQHTNLRGKGMATLVLGKWPLLQTLHIACCNLDSEGIEHLTAAAWPELNYLILDRNPLEAAAIANLTSGKWPHLQGLSLYQVFCVKVKDMDGVFTEEVQQGMQLDPAFLRPFTTAEWPNLARLTASDCNLNAANLAWLIQCQWAHLTTVNLSDQSLCAASCAIISQGTWPLLESLMLRDTSIDSVGMSHLILTNLPKLHHIDLSTFGLSLDEATLAVFAMNKWVSLDSISLHGNHMGPACITELIRGNWPKLKRLDVSGSELDVVAVSKLHPGEWPLLECLELADNEFTDQVMHLLSFGNQAGLTLDDNTITNPAEVSRGHWPKLEELIFSDPEYPSASMPWDWEIAV